MFCAEGYQAVTNETSSFTCAYDQCDNHLCLSFDIDFSECFTTVQALVERVWPGTTASSRQTMMCQERTGTKRLRNAKRRVSVVSYEIAHVGLRRTDGTFRHPNVIDERKELATRFILRAPARDALERPADSEGYTRVLPNICEELCLVKGKRLGMDESRQVIELQMDAVEQMNPLEGVGEKASSPQFKRP